MAVTEAPLRSTLRVLRIYMSVSLRLWRTARHGLERFRLTYTLQNTLFACVILSASIFMYAISIQVLLGGGDGGNRSYASFNASRSSHCMSVSLRLRRTARHGLERFRLPCVLKFTYLRALYFLLQYLCT